MHSKKGKPTLQEASDQHEGDNSVRALLHTYRLRKEIALLIDDRYPLFPYDLSAKKDCTYVVLGFYHIVHAWGAFGHTFVMGRAGTDGVRQPSGSPTTTRKATSSAGSSRLSGASDSQPLGGSRPRMQYVHRTRMSPSMLLHHSKAGALPARRTPLLSTKRAGCASNHPVPLSGPSRMAFWDRRS